jgi:hypothetical protein
MTAPRPYDAPVETEQHANPWDRSMLWAARAVPVLVIFGALDLLRNDPPLSFLVLTLVRLGFGVLALLAIHRRRRDRIALAYVVVVFLTSLPHPVRGGELLVLATLALVVTGLDLLWKRSHPVRQDETAPKAMDQTRAE